MALDFQLKVKMGGITTPHLQEVQRSNKSPTISNRKTSVLLITTIITCGAVAIQILPNLNKTWDETMKPWQSFLESQLGKPGKTKSTANIPTSGAIQDAQLISNISLVPGDSIAGHPVTSGYGPRVSPCSGCSSYHAAIDVGTPTGTPLYAPFDTTVQCPNYGGLAGLVAEFPSPEGTYTVQFLHLHDCTPGAAKKGQKIAESGDAGTGPHLDLRLKDKNGDRPIPSRELLEKVLKP